MQLLTCYSEEGDVDGLGLIEAQTLRFPSFNWDFHVPHMGWNKISPVKESKLCYGIDCKSLMYFVHTYYVKCADSKDILFKTKYGVEFDSGFEHENIAGFQFHPEKSHKAGLQLLQNFIKK
jgi:glutamine amidotransferase